jgi:hypothetical protein
MRWAIVTVAILLSGCVSQQQAPWQPVVLEPAGPYVHQATGFTFPVALGPFRRSGILEYNAEKSDVSAGYNKVSGEGRIAATVYVYPAPTLISIGSQQAVIDDAREHLCTQVWEAIQANIIRAHPGAELIVLDQIASPSPVFKKMGRRAIFRFTGNFGGTVQPLQSEADLFCYAGQRWLVSYRATAPAAFDYHADLDALMRGLSWPDSLGG